MQALVLPSHEPIAGGVRTVLDYVAPLQETWPLFRMRLLAVHSHNTWRIVFTQWMARVTGPTAPSIKAAYQQHSIWFDGWVTAPEAWEVLHQLATDGRALWTVPGAPSNLQLHLPSPSASRAGSSLPHEPGGTLLPGQDSAPLRESVPWRLAWAVFWAPYEDGGSDGGEWERAKAAAALEHGYGNFELLVNHLTQAPIGQDARMELEFPLAIEVVRLATAADHSTWEVRCRTPFTPDTLAINGTTESLWSADLPQLALRTVGNASSDGWSGRATFTVPRSALNLILSFRSTDKVPVDLTGVRLRYPINEVWDSREGLAAALFRGGLPEWETDLFNGTGGKLEIALANVLSRLGIPILFAGGETQAPGLDLVALHPMEPHRLAVISCKGGENGFEYKDIRGLRQAASRLRDLMPGWTVDMVAATNMSDEAFIGSRIEREPDLTAYGRSDLRRLWDAATLMEAVQWVWPPSMKPSGPVTWPQEPL